MLRFKKETLIDNGVRICTHLVYTGKRKTNRMRARSLRWWLPVSN